jgi:hypothetical protein
VKSSLILKFSADRRCGDLAPLRALAMCHSRRDLSASLNRLAGNRVIVRFDVDQVKQMACQSAVSAGDSRVDLHMVPSSSSKAPFSRANGNASHGYG